MIRGFRKNLYMRFYLVVYEIRGDKMRLEINITKKKFLVLFGALLESISNLFFSSSLNVLMEVCRLPPLLYIGLLMR